MQVTIKTDSGEFTADSIKEARKLEAKAKREEAKRHKEEAENYDIAKTESEALAFRIIEMALRSEKMPKAMSYRSPQSEHPEAWLERDKDSTYYGKISVRILKRNEYHTGTKDFYWRDKLLGYVWYYYGCALIHVHHNNSENPVWLAVGVHKGVLAFTEIPSQIGLSVEKFRMEGESTQS